MSITQQEITNLLDEVYDPELGLRITDLGLVYRVDVSAEDAVEIDFTLTYPGCPAADVIYENIDYTLRNKAEIKNLSINIVWDPPWGPEKMSEEARLMLGYPI